jgi:hypothetical protein
MGEIAGMSGTGYDKMIKKQTCTVETLEKFAEYFKISLAFFFDESTVPKAVKQVGNNNIFYTRGESSDNVLKDFDSNSNYRIKELEHELKLVKSEKNLLYKQIEQYLDQINSYKNVIDKLTK